MIHYNMTYITYFLHALSMNWSWKPIFCFFWDCTEQIWEFVELHGQETFLLRPYQNFASIKFNQGFPECFNYKHWSKQHYWHPIMRLLSLSRQDDYSSLSIKRFFAIYPQNNARIIVLKRLIHLVAGCMTLCFDSCFFLNASGTSHQWLFSLIDLSVQVNAITNIIA